MKNRVLQVKKNNPFKKEKTLNVHEGHLKMSLRNVLFCVNFLSVDVIKFLVLNSCNHEQALINKRYV